MHASRVGTALAFLATELALCSRTTLLLDFKERAVGVGAPRDTVAFDARCARILLVVDEYHVGEEGERGERSWGRKRRRFVTVVGRRGVVM